MVKKRASSYRAACLAALLSSTVVSAWSNDADPARQDKRGNGVDTSGLTQIASGNLDQVSWEVSGMLSMTRASNPGTKLWPFASQPDQLIGDDLAYIPLLVPGNPSGTGNCPTFGTVTVEAIDPAGDGIKQAGDTYRLTYQGCFTASSGLLQDGTYEFTVLNDLEDSATRRAGKYHFKNNMMVSGPAGTNYFNQEGDVDYNFVRDAHGWVSGSSQQALSAFGSRQLDNSGHEIGTSSTGPLSIGYTFSRQGRNRYLVQQNESWTGTRIEAYKHDYLSIDDGRREWRGTASELQLPGRPGLLDKVLYTDLAVTESAANATARLGGPEAVYTDFEPMAGRYLESRFGAWKATSSASRLGRKGTPRVQSSYSTDNLMLVLYKGGWVDGGGYFDVTVDNKISGQPGEATSSFEVAGRLMSPAGINVDVKTRQPLVWGRYGQPVAGEVALTGNLRTRGVLRVNADSRVDVAARFTDGQTGTLNQSWNNLPWSVLVP